MRIGLLLPQYDAAAAVEWARHADRLGFHSVWVSDHLFLDLRRYGIPGDEPRRCYDPLPALAALARATRRVRLGPLVLNAALRPPSVVAKAMATVDVLSGGRLVVGLGAGWYEREFEVAAVPFLPPAERLRQLRESIDIVRGLFTGGPFTYEGRHWSVHEARCLPRPVQLPSPPIWVGGKGDAVLRLAGRHADGWNTVWAMTPEDYAAKARVVAEASERAGRDPAAVTPTLGLYTLVGTDEADVRRRFERLPGATGPFEEWRRSRLVGTAEQVREQVDRWAQLGVAELIVAAGGPPFAITELDDVSLVAEACNLRSP